MFEFNQFRLMPHDLPDQSRVMQQASALQGAHRLFRKRYDWGKFRRVALRLINRPYRILDISSEKDATYRGCRYSKGIRPVLINWIHGTECRTNEFDYYFYPLTSAIRDRWINIAVLALLNISLPAVELICIENVFYARDGHHRVSVARALGQRHIDAQVLSFEREKKSGEHAWITIPS